MTQARDDFAAKISGREYGAEMTEAESVEAKNARLLVVFGASDDLTEFRGIIHDEVGAYDGAEHLVIRSLVSGGRLVIVSGGSLSTKPKGVRIDAIWEPDEPHGCSWLIKPSVPFASFDIMEDGELYCRGAVIDETDLLPAQRIVAVWETSNPQAICASFAEPVTKADIASIHEHLKGWSR